MADEKMIMQEAILARITSEALVLYLIEKGIVDKIEFREWEKKTAAILAKTPDTEASSLYQRIADFTDVLSESDD